MRKAAIKSRSTKLASPPTTNLNSNNKNAGCDRKADNKDISSWDNNDYIFRNRNNPFNGKNCFFSESTFNLIMGPEPSFEEKIRSQIARIKTGKQENKQADLSKSKPNKSEEASSSSKTEFAKGAEVNKPAAVTPLPIVVSLRLDDNIKSVCTTNNCQGIIQAGKVNTELPSDALTNISKRPDNFNKLKPEKNESLLELQIINDMEISQHVAVLSNESVDQDSVHLSVMTNLTNSCQSKVSSEVINSVLVSDSAANFTPSHLENLVKLNDQQTPEKVEQNNFIATVELLKDPKDSKHISQPSLHTGVSNQGVSNSVIVAVKENSSTNSGQPESVKAESDLQGALISDSVNSFPKSQPSKSSTNLSISESRCEDNGTAVVVKALEEEAEVPFLDGCSAEDGTKNNTSSLQAANELCLIMRSLSSDDDDEDDSEFNNPQSSDINNKPNECKEVVGKAAFSENQLQIDAQSLTTDADNASTSISRLPNSIQESAATTVDASAFLMHNNSGNLQFQSVIDAAGQGVGQYSAGGGRETHLLCQQPSQENYFDGGQPDSTQHTPTPAVSDIDIPIFSIKTSSPTKHFKPAPTNPEKQITAKLNGKLENQQMPEPTSQNRATIEDVNKNQKFKKSDLTKKEHAIYLQLYKYVRSFTQAGAPPVLTENQRKEISLFEELHRRVLKEQEEFQSYLQANARKNPSSFVFMKKMAKSYATCKARSYRLKKNYAAEFNKALLSHIPFCEDGSSVDLKFQRSLLEVGIPPRVKLPDVQIGQKPVPLHYDMQKLDASFPRYSKKNLPGFTHHEPVSLDLNVKQLATNYDFQVVMSSSSVKCLLDNHGPSFDRAWTIPIRVLELEMHGGPKRVVFLDKPLFENDLHIRDYNAVFHKYALRTFVSHPKQKLTQRNLFQPAPDKAKSASLDDPFDMLSSNVESLETFGAGLGKSFHEEASHVARDKGKLDSTKNVLEDSGKSNQGRKLRSNKQIYKDLDEVNNGFDQPLVGALSPPHADKSSSNSNSSSIKRKRGTHTGQLSRTGVSKTEFNTDSESEGEPKRKDIRRGYPVKDEYSLKPKPSSVLESAEADCDPHTRSHHNNNLLSSTIASPARSTRSQNCPQNNSSRQLLHHTLSIQIDDAQLSTSLDTPLSPVRYCPISPVTETPLSPTGESPMSPVGETPLSPTGESPMSPFGETPLSPTGESPLSPFGETPTSPPVRDIPLSPVKYIPTSPLQETSPSAVTTRQRHPCQTSTRSLSFNRSPDKKSNSPKADTSSSRIPESTKKGNKATSISGARQQIFTPLDSILGSRFGQPGERKAPYSSKEDPSYYLPPTEVHSSITYDLWSLRSVNILMRTRCHGVLKDLKKTRRIYFRPKMEHQTAYGLEQVTTSEVAREWTSCFVRPNTNLLRARINAFTSEIMMFEELETSQILRSSLNFKPEDGFRLLDRVLQQVLSLGCGKYLLAHEHGDNFCGIRSIRTGARSEEGVLPNKKMSNENNFRWIPIDPTILLPSHIAYNRIPATFLPKDVEVKNINSEGAKRSHPNTNKQMANKNDGNANGHWKKYKNKGKKKSRHP